MARPDITLLGATYSGVSGVTLPKNGGGTATFPWVEGSETKTQNGTYDVTTLAELIVNVSGGGGSGLTYESGEYTPTSNTAKPTISFSNTHASMPMFVMMTDATNTDPATTNTNHAFFYVDWYAYTGQGVPSTGATNVRYGYVGYVYRGNSTTNMSASNTVLTYPSTNTGSSSTSYPRYWVTETKFYPYSNSTSRYWRANRTYKWIAVWKPTT